MGAGHTFDSQTGGDLSKKDGLFGVRHGSLTTDKQFNASSTARVVREPTKHMALSVSQIRQSRQKIELDCVRLHNRIILLEAEEERANKIIEDTKNKVKQIMKSRAANEQF